MKSGRFRSDTATTAAVTGCAARTCRQPPRGSIGIIAEHCVA